MPDLKQLYDAVVSGDAKATHAITQQALTEGIAPLRLVNEFMVPAMDEVGRRFEGNDLGVNVAPERFIASVKEKNANIVAMSALLTTTMPAMKTTIEALKRAGVRNQVKVLIGGAPITQKHAEEIGADGYSENAVGAVTLAKKAVSVVAV